MPGDRQARRAPPGVMTQVEQWAKRSRNSRVVAGMTTFLSSSSEAAMYQKPELPALPQQPKSMRGQQPLLPLDRLYQELEGLLVALGENCTSSELGKRRHRSLTRQIAKIRKQIRKEGR